MESSYPPQASCAQDGPKSGRPATTLAPDFPRPTFRPSGAPYKAKAGRLCVPWPGCTSGVSAVVGRRFRAARPSVGRDSTIVRIYSGFLYTFGFSFKAYKIPLIPSASNAGLPTQPGYQDAAQGRRHLGGVGGGGEVGVGRGGCGGGETGRRNKSVDSGISSLAMVTWQAAQDTPLPAPHPKYTLFF